jgi:hypothetical protein
MSYCTAKDLKREVATVAERLVDENGREVDADRDVNDEAEPELERGRAQVADGESAGTLRAAEETRWAVMVQSYEWTHRGAHPRRVMYVSRETILGLV